MTDKEIMIDGVDVSGCEDFREGYCHPDTGVCYKCDTNCQYAAFYLKEQLARKTQECEALKSESFTMDSLITEQEEEIEKLKEYAQRQENQRETYYKEFLRRDKALEEIEKVCLEDTHTFADGTQIRYDSLDDILDIINKVKGEE